MVAGALGAAAPAFATDRDTTEDRGAIDVGPLGRRSGAPQSLT